jgi:hypothetical protein
MESKRQHLLIVGDASVVRFRIFTSNCNAAWAA